MFKNPFLIKLLFFVHFIIPTTLFANIPLPTVFAFSVPIWLGFSTFLFSFIAVVIIETYVLKFCFKKDFRKSFQIIIIVNAITTFIGFMFSSGFIGLSLIATIIFIHYLIRKNFKLNPSRDTFLTIFYIALFIGSFFIQLFNFGNTIIESIIINFYLVMFYSFLVTLFIEGLLFAHITKQKNAFRWTFYVNGASYFFLFFILLIGGFRSSTLALTDWPIFKLRSQANRNTDKREILRNINEIYEWKQMKSKSSFLNSFIKKYETVPSFELEIVKNWAEGGNVKESEELMNLILAYHKMSDKDYYPYYKWKEALEEIEKAKEKKERKEERIEK